MKAALHEPAKRSPERSASTLPSVSGSAGSDVKYASERVGELVLHCSGFMFIRRALLGGMLMSRTNFLYAKRCAI
jgi:hypothetical protein